MLLCILFSTLLLITRAAPSQRELSPSSCHDAINMDENTRYDMQAQDYEHTDETQYGEASVTNAITTLTHDNWKALPFNIFYPRLNIFHKYDQIDFSRDTLLDPSLHGPKAHAKRQKQMEKAYSSGLYNSNDYSYQLDKENDLALLHAMHFVSINDQEHGLVSVPSHNLTYYHPDMSEDEVLRRWQAKEFLSLHYDARSNHYWTSKPENTKRKECSVASE